MKIAYIANVRMPTEKAHGIQISKMCSALSKQGHDLVLVVPKRRNGIKEDMFDYYGVSRTFRIEYVPVPELIRFGRWGFLVQSALFAWRAARYVSRSGAEAAYSREALPLLFLFGRGKIRKYWEAHDGRKGIVPALVLRALSGLVVITEGLADYYRKRFGYVGPVLVAPDAFDPEDFESVPGKAECRLRCGLPSGAKIALYAGHLYAWKGVDVLAEAAKRLPEALVVFVGGTDHDIDRFRRQYGAVPNVAVAGRKPHEAVPYYLGAADVLVLPNSGKTEISAKYTSPLKLFEYMASGTPIAASDLPSIREILSERNAFLSNPDDPSALAERIRRIFDNPVEAGIIGERARLDAMRYTWQSRAEKIAKFLA